MGININADRPTLECDCCKREVTRIKRVNVGGTVMWVCDSCISVAVGKMVDGHSKEDGNVWVRHGVLHV